MPGRGAGTLAVLRMNKRTLKRLRKLEGEIERARRISLHPQAGWNDDVPSLGGVYVVWEKKSRKPVYVGETCHLKLRFSDLRRNVNHTFRRQIAKRLRLQHLSDTEISNRLSKKYSVSYRAIKFGRKELEEYLVLRWRRWLINKPQKRLLLNDEYADIMEL